MDDLYSILIKHILAEAFPLLHSYECVDSSDTASAAVSEAARIAISAWCMLIRTCAWDIAAKLVATILRNFRIRVAFCAGVLHFIAISCGALHLP